MDIKKADLLGYCMGYVEEAYLKVACIDLKNDRFEVCKLVNDIDVPAVETLTGWVAECINSNLIHSDDVEKFRQFVNIDKWRKWIAETDKGAYCSYRRKGKSGEFIHVSICIIRDKGRYKDGQEFGILFVKDINSIYEAEYACILENIGTTDSFTKLLNRVAYQRDLERYKGGNVGVLFVDINGLKYVNDKNGHAAGDKLVLDVANLLKRAFADFRIYHISGDEFVVVAYDVSLRSFLQRVLGWHRFIWESGDYPVVSVGYSLDADTQDVSGLVTEAEAAMYVDKDIFYSRYPQYKR